MLHLFLQVAYNPNLLHCQAPRCAPHSSAPLVTSPLDVPIHCCPAFPVLVPPNIVASLSYHLLPLTLSHLFYLLVQLINPADFSHHPLAHFLVLCYQFCTILYPLQYFHYPFHTLNHLNIHTLLPHSPFHT